MRSQYRKLQCMAAWLCLALAVAPTTPVLGADLFWTVTGSNPNDPAFSLYRADTSDVQGTRVALIHSLEFQPDYNSLAASGTRIYLRQFSSHEVYSLNFDGTGFGPDVPPSNQLRAELAGRLLDAAGVNSYIPDALVGTIYRGDLEFENQQQLISTPRFVPNMALALDETAGKLYWAGGGNGALLRMGRANIDGSGEESLAIGDVYFDDYPADIALDTAAGKIYWINLSEHKIQRANLDGSGVEDVLSDVVPFSLTLVPVPEPTTVVLLGIGLAISLWVGRLGNLSCNRRQTSS